LNTHLPNVLVHEAWLEGRVPHWQHYSQAKREFKLSEKTRLDLVFLEGDEPVHFVEVKNVTLADGNTALFPDSKTERGQKHLRELIELSESGKSTEMVFVVQRTDCVKFSPAADIDPEYARLLRLAHKAGVRISVYASKMSQDEIRLHIEEPLAFEL
jgi:sugar fermentation stimulation protein A